MLRELTWALAAVLVVGVLVVEVVAWCGLWSVELPATVRGVHRWHVESR
jgi:hypothetical protein